MSDGFVAFSRARERNKQESEGRRKAEQVQVAAVRERRKA